MKKLLLLIIIMVIPWVDLRAQSVDLFGGYSYIEYGKPTSIVNSWQAAVTVKCYRSVITKLKITRNGYSVMTGPKVSGKLGPYSYFARVLLGIDRSFNPGPMADFNGEVGVGFDRCGKGRTCYRLFQADYLLWKKGPVAQNFRISTGVVVKL